MRSKWLVLPLVLLGSVVVSGWGFLVHRTVNQLAIYELPKPMQAFFFSEMKYLVTQSVRPDQRRSSDKTEATKHFIDLEMYEADAANRMPELWQDAMLKYTRDTLVTYGYVPYHVMYMKEKLTQAFREKSKDSILFYAADMGHYIADANVPLHTTINYDGQLTGQKGVHSLWESMIPEIEMAHYQLHSRHKATYLQKPEKAIWQAVREGFNMLPVLLAKEKEVSIHFTDDTKYRTQIRRGKESKSYSTAFAKAYAQSLGTSINDRLIRSADLIADFWYTCWVDAGKPDLSGMVTKLPVKNITWNKHLRSYQQNQLQKNGLLLAKQPTADSL